jgi:hypothetical protein
MNIASIVFLIKRRTTPPKVGLVSARSLYLGYKEHFYCFGTGRPSTRQLGIGFNSNLKTGTKTGGRSEIKLFY